MFIPALRLQLGQHTLLTVHAGGLADQQPLGEIFFVKSFKHVLAVDKSEDDHNLVQEPLQLLFTCFFVASSQL